MMFIPLRDKAGVTHARRASTVEEWRSDNHHAGWRTVRAHCGTSVRIRPSLKKSRAPKNIKLTCLECIAAVTR